jgi:integrase/recombinase XerD
MSELKAAVHQYLEMRRSLGFKLRDEGVLLPRFVEFMEQLGAPFITVDLALQWAMQAPNATPVYWAVRLRMVRIFASYHSATDRRTQIPSQYLLPYRYHRKKPHIYNDDELMHLLKAAAKLTSPKGLRASTYGAVFGLLSATGVRISEAVALDRQDVDLARRILTIRHSKFGKSRLVPIHPSVQGRLKTYEALRDSIIPSPQTHAFFISEAGKRLTKWIVERTFVKLSREIGLRGPLDSHGPRLHDFRHTFAVRTMLSWYKSDDNIERRIAHLATYLGHRHVNDTYWYLSAVPELMKLVADRLDSIPGGLI